MEINALPTHQEYHTCVWFSVAHGGYRAFVLLWIRAQPHWCLAIRNVRC